MSHPRGAERVVELRDGPVRLRERGSGAPIVFLHGVFMNGDAWSPIVPALAERHRCITPDWPTGGHSLPLHPDARVTPHSLAEMAAELLERLKLDDATLVGIGLGTVLCEMLAIRRPERVGRIVFASGDILSTFPPLWARARFWVAYLPPLARVVVLALGAPRVRRQAFGRFTTSADDALFSSFTHGVRGDAGVRRDTLKLIRAIVRGRTDTDHADLARFAKPALIVWGEDDRAFPQSHPDDLAALLRDARIERIPGARTFLAQDAPERFARLIDEFAR